MSGLLEPFQFGFFRQGLVVATVAGALCGMVGVYVVLRGMSYIGHGLSHAIFGGAAASVVTGVNLYAGAGLWGVASALLIGRVARRRVVGPDAAIGVVTTASFAVGLLIFEASGRSGAARGAEAVLFGNVLAVTATDVVVVTAVALAAGAVVFLRYRALLFASFDPEVADASGVSTARADALLMVVLATCILATMKVIGVVLIAAMLVIPASVARLLTNRFASMLWVATAVGAACGGAGMYLSYSLDVPSGATIVVVAAAAFALAFTASEWRLHGTSGNAR